MRAAPVLSMAALAATLAACAPMTRVVLLPQPGHGSVVEVAPRASASGQAKAAQGAAATPDTAGTLLTQPYQTAAVNAKDRVSVQQWDAAHVQSRYGALLAAQPPAASRYLLYFEFNGTQLTPESAVELDEVIAKAMARPGNEIVVTGHADSVGTVEANDRISLQRAQMIRQAIIARGFDPARVYAVGRGARDPLMLTGDQTAEQKNRRVEITVR